MTLLKSATHITPKSTPITIHLSSLLNLVLWRAAGDPLTAGGAADLKSKSIIKINGPMYPKINSHINISAISYIITISDPYNPKIFLNFGVTAGGG